MIKYVCTISLSLFIFFSCVNCSESTIDDVVNSARPDRTNPWKLNTNPSVLFNEYYISGENLACGFRAFGYNSREEAIGAMLKALKDTSSQHERRNRKMREYIKDDCSSAEMSVEEYLNKIKNMKHELSYNANYNFLDQNNEIQKIHHDSKVPCTLINAFALLNNKNLYIYNVVPNEKIIFLSHAFFTDNKNENVYLLQKNMHYNKLAQISIDVKDRDANTIAQHDENRYLEELKNDIFVKESLLNNNEDINVNNNFFKFPEYELSFEENFQEYKNSIHPLPEFVLNNNEDIIILSDQECNAETQGEQGLYLSRNLLDQTDKVGQKRKQKTLKETSPPRKVPCIAIKNAENDCIDADVLTRMIPKILKIAINADVTKKSWKNLSIKLKSMWDPYNERSFDEFFSRLVEFMEKRNLYKEFESSLTNISKSVKFKNNANNYEEALEMIVAILNKKQVDESNYEECLNLTYRIKAIWDVKNEKNFNGLNKFFYTQIKKFSSTQKLVNKMKIMAHISDKLYRDTLPIKAKGKEDNYEEIIENIKNVINTESVNKSNHEECVKLIRRIKTIWDSKNKKTFIGLSRFLRLEYKKISSNVELAEKIMIMSNFSKKLYKNSFLKEYYSAVCVEGKSSAQHKLCTAQDPKN
jgi:hypothetical protein